MRFIKAPQNFLADFGPKKVKKEFLVARIPICSPHPSPQAAQTVRSKYPSHTG